MNKSYVEVVRLLLEAARHVFHTSRFALKGGTALNLFMHNMPRLSVDIDVVYTDHQIGRDEAIKEIGNELTTAMKNLAREGIAAESLRTKTGDEVKILVKRANSQVKVEVNFVFRGTLLPIETRNLVASAQELFTTHLSLPLLAESEIYGSKLVAALDRQHPREIFDVRGMFQNSGLTLQSIECFVCYLAGHNRPIHEVLFSRDLDLTMAYENEFQGMTLDPVSLAELVATRARLRLELAAAITSQQKQFLLSIARAEPEWNLMNFPHLSKMPAIRWKLENLAKLKKMNPAKFALQTADLEKRFSS